VVATLRFPETPYCYTLTCRPSQEDLTVEIRTNVRFGSGPITLTGHPD
jgi:hypothetical protein